MLYRIFIIEDDPKIASAISEFLRRYGYGTALVTDFQRVLQELLKYDPHLVIMDVNLPYQDGYHLCRILRKHSQVPVVFLSARAGDMEQVMGIESGGDDYVTKPFSLDVLHAKIKAVLRRTYGEYSDLSKEHSFLHIGDLQLDLTTAEIRMNDKSQPVTKNELKLLHVLMTHADQVVSRETCLEALWDDIAFVDDNTLTVNVSRLRSKLGCWGCDDAIETKRGLGYKLVSERLVRKQ